MNSNDFWNRGTPDYSPQPFDQIEEAQVEGDEMLTVVPVGEDQIEEDDSFSLDKFQVVRREFFSHISEPSITFNNYKIGLNSACIKRLPQIDYIQFLVNRQTRKLAIRPCLESDLHSFQWCTNSGGKRKPRQVTGKIFFMKLFDMMGWNPNYRYKILGKLIRANGEYLFVFDLTSTEVYQRIVKEGTKPKMSRTPVFRSIFSTTMLYTASRTRRLNNLPFRAFRHRQNSLGFLLKLVREVQIHGRTGKCSNYNQHGS